MITSSCILKLFVAVCIVNAVQLSGERRAPLSSTSSLKNVTGKPYHAKWKPKVPLETRRVIHGTQARPKQFPFMALVFFSPGGSEGENVRCGGSIIHKRWVLSASHCFRDNDTLSLFIIMIGMNHIWTDNPKNYKIENVFKHPAYFEDAGEKDRLGIFKNDIALVRTSRDMDINNDTTMIVRLGERKCDYSNMATVIGWGHYREPLVVPTGRRQKTNLRGANYLLRYADLPIVQANICKQRWYYMTDELYLCTGTNNREQRFCKGDSGGPLMIDGVQRGIVSASDGKCSPYKNVIYTRVSAFIEFIRFTLKEFKDDLPPTVV